MVTTFERELSRVLVEMVDPLGRITKLAQLIQQVAKDFGTDLQQKEVIPPSDDFGEASFDVVDAEGTVLWLKLVLNPDGKIAYYDILAAPSQGQEWDFTDLELSYPYESFLGDVSDLELEPPAKDYGLDILNIIAWVIYAHQQIVANEPDLDNLYEAGYYKVRVTVADPEQGQATVGYWLQATSSEDARQQMIDMAGKKLVGKPEIVQFRKEEADY